MVEGKKRGHHASLDQSYFESFTSFSNVLEFCRLLSKWQHGGSAFAVDYLFIMDYFHVNALPEKNK